MFTENRIRELRDKKKMSQVRLSIELGVSQETVSAYESGKHFPSYNMLVKLSDLFGVSIDYLMGRTDFLLLSNNLNEKEQLVLTTFRKLNPMGEAMAEAYMQGLFDSNNTI